MSQASRTPSGAAFTELILEVFRLNGQLLATGDRLVAPLGLTSARWQVVGAIVAAATPETVARLARTMGLRRQGVQRIVDELHEEGWVEFVPNPHHRRAKLVQLTPRGVALHAEVVALQVPWANAAADGFDAEAIDGTKRLLAALRARLEAIDGDGG